MPDKNTCNSQEILYKSFAFEVQNTKKVKRDDQEYGVIEGFASTYGNKDRGGDVVVEGAFSKSLQRHRKTKRPIRMLYQHNRDKLIGGYPIDKVRDDEKGLYVVGEVNLEVPEGKAAYALAKQGVLSDLSIGYSIIDASQEKDAYYLKELELWEVSPVAEPMNPEATIVEVKGVTPFKDFPIADRGTRWDADAADKRLRKFVGAEEAPNARYKTGFMWYDSENQDNFTAYKLQYVDVVDDKLQVIPRAIFAIAAVLRGARGGVDIPEADKKRVEGHVNRYYAKMGLESPLKNLEVGKHYEYFEDIFTQKIDNVSELTNIKDVETWLKNLGLSSSNRKILISKIKSFSRDAEKDEVSEERDVQSNLEEQLQTLMVSRKLDELNNLLKG